MATKRPCQKGCSGGILLMSLIFCIQMVKTCLLFFFAHQIILGEFLLGGWGACKVVTNRFIAKSKTYLIYIFISELILDSMQVEWSKEIKFHILWKTCNLTIICFMVDWKRRCQTICSGLGLDGSFVTFDHGAVVLIITNIVYYIFP